MRPAYLPAALSLTPGSPLRRRSRSARFAASAAALSLTPGLPLRRRRSRSRPVRRFGGGSPARARFAASVRRSRAARLAASDGGAPAHARFAALCFGAAVSGGGKDSLCDLSAALPLRPARRPLFRRGGFRRRKRLFVRLFVAALPLAPGSPLRCGALARARLAASVRRSRSARLAALCFGGAPARARLGSPLRCGAPAPLGLPLRCGSPSPLGSPPSVSARRFQAAEKALCATFRRRSRSARFAALCFGAAVSGGGKGSLCDLSAALSLRSVRRFVAALWLAPGSPLCGGAIAHARFAALWRRSRSRSVRRFGGAPARARFAALCFGGALAHARFAASVLFYAASSQSC